MASKYKNAGRRSALNRRRRAYPISDCKIVMIERDYYWLRETVELAKRCPPSDSALSVGAILVGADGLEITRGYSRDSHPTVHAEESALEKLSDKVRAVGATMYSSMEPCAERRSRSRTCVDLIAEASISRVVFLNREPVGLVLHPQGMDRLERLGIEVVHLTDFGELDSI